MNKIEAIATAKQIEKVCEYKDDVYCRVIYDKRPELKFIEIEIKIKIIDTKEAK